MMRREDKIFLGCVLIVAMSVLFATHITTEAQQKAAPVIMKTLPEPPLATEPRTGETWYVANQGTFAWDAPTTLVDGTLIPAGAIIKYQAWRRPYSVSSPEKSGVEITATQATIAFSPEGSFLVGVEALRYDGTILVSSSGVSWSDNAAVCKDSKTFGFRHFLAFALPKGLRPVN